MSAPCKTCAHWTNFRDDWFGRCTHPDPARRYAMATHADHACWTDGWRAKDGSQHVAQRCQPGPDLKRGLADMKANAEAEHYRRALRVREEFSAFIGNGGWYYPPFHFSINLDDHNLRRIVRHGNSGCELLVTVPRDATSDIRATLNHWPDHTDSTITAHGKTPQEVLGNLRQAAARLLSVIDHHDEPGTEPAKLKYER